ncbi:MAG: protein kinase [Candidatus Eisenbacteria bacterium]|nr:protein kinase [Candidatus Eisenbacteria bacterium]
MNAEEAEWVRLANDIADGTPIDWSEANGRARAPEDRNFLTQLKLVSEIAELHRSAHASILRGPGEPALAAVAPGTSALPPGERWGDFEIVRRIGEGSFGEVYRARDLRLDREVALKLMRADRLRPELAEALTREGRLLARVRHPNVVTVHGAEEVEGRVGLSMELVDGRTLEAILSEQGPMSAGEATLVGIELCRALAALHEAGLVHRDVKTQNVMREAKGRIVLMDLGVGIALTDLNQERPVLAGTPFYMAPELLSGSAASPSSDLYSVGVLLYRLVTGRFPVEARRLSELKAAHASGEIRLLRDLRPDLPSGFIQVIETCVAFAPEQRYASAGQLEDALMQAMGGGPQRSPAESPRSADVVRAGRAGARRLAWGLGLAAVALTATALLLIGREQARNFDIEAGVFRVGTGGVTERLAPGAQVSVGDFLGLEVEGSRDLHIYVLSKDEKGESYLLFPLPGFDLTNPISAAVRHRLPGSRNGEELFWEVSSAGGRERLLVLASPKRLDDLEAEVRALPRPEIGGPVAMALPLSKATVGRLRGIGSLGSGLTADGRSRSGDIFDAARAVARGRERAKDVWVREIELANPGSERP